ncbi:MAG TPA: nucleotide disphospho-sugar-binding domain-containing protein [Thermomicrobiales bacterium]|nr:nucleotide disphospho-sugar-binding domain-containing protein [Thermomicrobiales bacterium]
MRVLLAALGSAGDVHPLLGIGLALRGRGHAVTLVTNEAFEGPARRLGLDFIALGTRADAARMMRDPDLWHPTRGFGVIARRVILPNVAPLYEIVARHDPTETVVCASSVCFGARIAQERLGYRLVTHHLAPALLWSRAVPPASASPAFDRLPAPFQVGLHRLVVAVADRILAPPVNDFRQRLGLAPARDLLYGWCNAPERVLGLFPAWFAPPQPDWPPQVRLTGFPLFDPPDEGEADGEPLPEPGDGPAPLVFTPGSANVHARAFFAAAVEASRLLGRPAILLTRHREQLPARLPAGVVHRDYLPLGALLPGAAALVHHGGIGTTAQGLAAGIPHLVMPMSHDQPDNAARLRRLGVGAALPPRRFTGRAVADALDRLLGSEGVLERCRALAARCDPAANIETARAIEAAGEGSG